MSNVGMRTEREFESDFPINFGKGVRGDFVRYRNKVAGIFFAHRKKDGVVCGGTVYWVKIEGKTVWKLLNAEPLTLDESIRCDCGLHGWIREGQWEHASDSIQ